MLPGPQHRQEIVGVATAKIGFPTADQKILERGEADAAPHLLAVEGLAQSPAGIDAAHRLEAADRLGREPAILPGRVGSQRRLDAFEKHIIVRRSLGRAADRRDALDPIGEQRAPVKGLLRPHRKTVDELDPLDAEHLGQQALLHPHIVGHREMRVAPAVEGRRRVARRGGQPVAELVDDDDEIFGWIERPARRDQPFEVVMLRAVGGGVDDDVGFRGVERAVRLIGELGVAVGQPGLQHDIAGLEDLVIGHIRRPLDSPPPGDCFVAAIPTRFSLRLQPSSRLSPGRRLWKGGAVSNQCRTIQTRFARYE